MHVQPSGNLGQENIRISAVGVGQQHLAADRRTGGSQWWVATASNH